MNIIRLDQKNCTSHSTVTTTIQVQYTSILLYIYAVSHGKIEGKFLIIGRCPVRSSGTHYQVNVIISSCSYGYDLVIIFDCLLYCTCTLIHGSYLMLVSTCCTSEVVCLHRLPRGKGPGQHS